LTRAFAIVAAINPIRIGSNKDSLSGLTDTFFSGILPDDEFPDSAGQGNTSLDCVALPE
jgi:hypothetical protein